MTRSILFSVTLFVFTFGHFGLAASANGLAKDCVQKYDLSDCIIASIGLVISVFATRYKVTSGFSKATHEDLGYENDGSFHHYHIDDSDKVKDLPKRTALGHPDLEKRLEERVYGVVIDYLWQNGNKDSYNQMHDSADFKGMTRKIDNYMEGNEQGVSCLSPIGTIGTHDRSSRFRVDNGILAYGWNDMPS